MKNIEDIILEQLKNRLSNHVGLSVFAQERAKFEGWLKVELCDILAHNGIDVFPEKNRIDIVFNDYAIELKTVNTNLRYQNAKNKTRPITKNTESVIGDIKKLKETSYKNKAVLFIAFPAEHKNEFWNKQLSRIKDNIKNIRHEEFIFKNGIPGIIYLGAVE
jgi:hypothetical protein